MRFELHNTASVSARARLVNAQASWAKSDFPIQFGMFHHPRKGLILVDTGYSSQLFASRDPHVMFYRRLLRPRLLDGGDALGHVQRLGARADDVRHIVLTHLHADHICGLAQFPKAEIIASRASLAAWRGQAQGFSPWQGYFPSLLPPPGARHLRAAEDCSTISLPWGGKGHDLLGDGSAVSVDLPGHMPGHIGVFFPHLAKPLLHAADATWTHDTLDPQTAMPWPARMISADVAACRNSKAIIAAAQRAGCQITLCHDVNHD